MVSAGTLNLQPQTSLQDMANDSNSHRGIGFVTYESPGRGFYSGGLRGVEVRGSGSESVRLGRQVRSIEWCLKATSSTVVSWQWIEPKLRYRNGGPGFRTGQGPVCGPYKSTYMSLYNNISSDIRGPGPAGLRGL